MANISIPRRGAELWRTVVELVKAHNTADDVIVALTDYSGSIFIGGTGWALGNGTWAVAEYAIDENGMVDFAVVLTWGSSSTYGSGDEPQIALPVDCHANWIGQYVWAHLRDAGSDNYTAVGRLDTSVVHVSNLDTNANNDVRDTAPTSTAPFTIQAGDQLFLAGRYRKA